MSQSSERADPSALETALPAPDLVVDARGHRCPTPTLRLRRALEAALDDARIMLLADDPLARIDVPHFLAQHGYAPATIAEADGVLRITVRKQRDRSSFGKDCVGIP